MNCMSKFEIAAGSLHDFVVYTGTESYNFVVHEYGRFLNVCSKSIMFKLAFIMRIICKRFSLV